MLRIGDVVASRYRVDHVIGEGGRAVVFCATDLALDIEVALKVLRPEVAERTDAAVRLVGEARLLARLKSPNAVRVLDVGALEGGAGYIVTELLEGLTLRALLTQRASLPVSLAAHLVSQACDAVGEAHALGVVHRDLTPANLFLARSSRGSTVVKVLDFGRSRFGPGSPPYMSPEQIRSPSRVDGRADIWSLGVVLYEAVSGRLPFEGDTALPEAPRAFEGVVACCLENDPSARYRSIAELRSALVHHERCYSR